MRYEKMTVCNRIEGFAQLLRDGENPVQVAELMERFSDRLIEGEVYDGC